MKDLVACSKNQIDKADDLVFSLATGSLALSITFKSGLITPDTTALLTLKLSWMAFVVCVLSRVAVLFAFAHLIGSVYGSPSVNISKSKILMFSICRFMFYGGFVFGILQFTIFAIKNT